MNLFDFIKILFVQPEKWVEISDSEKRKQFFLVNRFLGIQHPLQASILGHQKINQVGVMDFWQRFLRTKYKKKIPFWIYTKGAKKAKAAKEKKLKISHNTIVDFALAFKLDIKSVEKAIEFFPDKMQKELKGFFKNEKYSIKRY